MLRLIGNWMSRSCAKLRAPLFFSFSSRFVEENPDHAVGVRASWVAMLW